MRYVTASPDTGASAFRRIALALGIVGALCAVLAFSASAAKAETVGFSFDRGVINLGGEEEGLWAKLVDPDLTPPDAPATVNAEVAGDGTLTAAADQFFFPPKRIENLATGDPILPFVDANVAISAEDALSGTFDAATGEASIVLPADVLITVYQAGSPASAAKCRIDGFDLTMVTSGSMSDPGDAEADPPRDPATYDAAMFAPPNGDGAVIAPWEGLPASSNEGGTLGGIICPKLDEMLGGPGGIWLSGKAGGGIEGEPPTLAPKLTGTPASSTESTTADFAYEMGEGESRPVTGFVCKVDAGAFEPCDEGSKSYTGLTTGSHSFEVKAVNGFGQGPSSTFSWTITELEVCPPGQTGTPPDCVTPPKAKAKLAALKIQPKAKAVKRAKKAVFTVKVRNAGKATAKGVKVCVNAPKRLVQVKKCVNVGQVAAGKTKNAKFKVTVKKKARKGKKVVLKFTAKSNNAGSKSGKATVKVK